MYKDSERDEVAVCGFGTMDMKRHREKLDLMELLPMELLVEILKRLPAKWVCHIRCVCKMLSIVDSPSFVSLHSKLVLDPHSHLPPAPPQLLLHCCVSPSRHHPNYEKLCTFHSLHYDSSNTQGSQLNPRFILQLSADPTFYSLEFVFNNLCCIKCCNDLFKKKKCCDDDEDALSFLINPLRREVLRLPPCIPQKVFAPKVQCHSIGMGFDSVTNTYKILRVTNIHTPYDPPEESCSVSQVLVLGTSEWRQVPSTPPSGALPQSNINNVSVYGDMHWLLPHYTRRGVPGHIHILSFDFKKEEFFWSPNPCIFKGLSRQSNLINYRGSMAIVDTTPCPNIEIRVLKDYSRKQWMLDYSININMLELDHQFEFWRVVCCEWEHGILFIDQKEKNKKTLFLNLRGPVVTKNLLKFPFEGYKMYTWCMSLNGSLMSLKSYANLGEAEEPATYRNWSQGEASRKNFFYFDKVAQRH